MNVNHCELLQTTPDEKSNIFTTINITEESILKDCQDLQKWYELQPHLPKPAPDIDQLQRFLIINKASKERVKKILDMKCLLRLLRPEFFRYSDFFDTGFPIISKNIYWIPLPKLSKDLCRVSIMKIVGGLEDFSLIYHIKRSYMYGDFRLKNECCLADRYILDLGNMKLGHLTRLNPVVLNNAEMANKEAFGTRIAGLHILNAPPFVDKFLALMKRALKPKLAGRIKCHANLEDLYKDVDKDILPVEYGGCEKSLDVLNDEWCKVITSEKWRKILTDEEKLVSDESKRINFPHDKELLGIQGSFKKLDID